MARAEAAELPEGPARALPRLVRQAPEAGGDDARGRRARKRSPARHPSPRPGAAPDARERLEKDLAAAQADFVKTPDDADTIIWLGRRLAASGGSARRSQVFTRGLEKHPVDPRLLRHRGHRCITLRELRQGRRRPPAGGGSLAGQARPGARRRSQPAGPLAGTSAPPYNVYYHLGLAHYLRGDFARALPAYRECLRIARGNDDRLVATTDWLYITLRRLGKDEEARSCSPPISPT